LVELLVVIGIITILIGLLLPVLSRARDAALTAQCANNMRQNGQATIQYISDSQGFLPPYLIQWNSGGLPYVNSPYIFQWLPAFYEAQNARTWVCPADNFQLSDDHGEVGPQRGPYPEIYSGRSDIYYSYAINFDQPLGRALLYPSTNNSYFNPGLALKVTQSASFMFLHETNELGGQTYNDPTNYFRFNHQGNTAMNVLYLDGHVDTRKVGEILPPGPTLSSNLRAFWFGRPDATSQLLF